MRNLLYVLFYITISFTSIYTQVDPECGLTSSPLGKSSAFNEVDLSQEGGIYLTSQGTLKVLVVFVRFKDDNSYHPYWPAGQAPLNYNTFVDPDLQTGSSHYVNLTNYFNKMSFGAYKVIGQSVSVETPNVMSYYGSPPFMNRHLATKEVLQQKVDPLVNFADYDNWSSNANYTHSNQPDGTVDMVIMIWRTGSSTFHFGGSDNWSGEASLGYGSSYEVEGGNKTIKTGFGLNSGSGVTLHYWGERSPERNFKNTVHEIGHWLL